jgi:hypothetical protein
VKYQGDNRRWEVERRVERCAPYILRPLLFLEWLPDLS